MKLGDRCPCCGYVEPDLLDQAALLYQALAQEQYRAAENWLTERRFGADTTRAERLAAVAVRAVQRLELRQARRMQEDLRRG